MSNNMITMDSKRMETLYKIYLSTFESFKKNASKKDKNYKELKDAYTILKETAIDFSNPENLKRYSTMLVSALESNTIKIIEKSLMTIDQIISHELIDYNNLQEMIKSILTHLYAKSMLNDDNINYKILNLCIIIYSSKLVSVNGVNLINIIKVSLNIFLSSKNQNCQNMAKLTLIQIVDYMIEKLDSFFNPIPSNKYFAGIKSFVIIKKENEEIQSHNMLGYNREIGMANEYNFLLSKYINFYMDLIEIDNSNNGFLSQVTEILKTSSSDSNAYLELAQAVESLKLDDKEMKNESDIKSGKFGWCIYCRNQANFFSEKINFPICGNDCEVELFRLNKLIDIDIKIDSSNYRDDYINTLKILSKLSIKEPKQQNYIEQINLKLREFCLELIHTLIEKGAKYFLNENKLILVIKESTMDSLVKNTLSNEMNIFKLSINLFLTIISNFREHLKDEIEIFINRVLIAILESENLGFVYKEVILDALMKLADNCNFLVEIYVNYDCDINHKNIFYELINLMTKIINGMYKKVKYVNTFKPLQEANLRIKCLDFLTKFIRNLAQLVEENDARSNAGVGVSTFTTRQVGILSQNENPNETYLPEDDMNVSMMDTGSMFLDIKDKINQNLKLKAIISKAIDKFNINPSSCINFLRAHELLPDENTFNTIKNKFMSSTIRFSNKVTPSEDDTRDKTLPQDNHPIIAEEPNINNPEAFSEASNTSIVPSLNFISSSNPNPLLCLLQSLDSDSVLSLTYEEFIAREMARFIKCNQKELNRESVGSYLCSHKLQNQRALFYFIETFNFKNFHILEALRVLFAELPIAGEGQIIDRVIQMFGQKYHKENPSAFKNPDHSYYISMSIMMLNTDLHREEVEKKMPLSVYIKRVKELCLSEVVDESYLTDVYNRIQTDPLMIPGLKIASNKNKKELIKLEKESILKSTFEELQSKTLISANYISQIDNDHIKHLIEASWSNFLGIFSQLLADFDEETIVNTCIDNILIMARMCGIIRLDTISEAFINTIINMTNLMEGREIKQKNFECTKSLIDFAMQSGNHIRTCWFNILNIISKIDYYHTIGGQFKNEAELFSKEIRRRSKLRNPEKEIEIELKNCELICQNISNIFCDNIFSKTMTFDEEGIVNFVNSLCKVSRNELDHFFNPRIYSLHKLVEVADFNIFRIQIEWAKIWKLISEHLVFVITNYNHDNICNDAIDSLRQTVIKLLQKPDLSIYNFQMDFFKPYEIIFNQSVNRSQRSELILTCLAYIVQNSKNIHSGWIIIFNILKNGLKRKDSKLNSEIVTILQTISEDFSVFNTINQEVFRGYIECLCHMYLEDNLKKFSFETILKLLAKIISTINSIKVTPGTGNMSTNTSQGLNFPNYSSEKKFEFLKIFFHGFDDLLRINVIEHLNLLFEIISSNRELIFSSDVNSFIYSYYCYFKPHLVTLLFHFFDYRLNLFESEQCLNTVFTQFRTKSTIDEIYFNTKIYLENSLMNTIEILEEEKMNSLDKSTQMPSNGILFGISTNGGNSSDMQSQVINCLKNIVKCYDKDSDLIIKKLEILKSFDIKNYEIALEFFLEKFLGMITKISDSYMNYKFFYEDLIITLLNLSIFNENSDIIFKIIGKNLLSMGNELSQYCWNIINSNNLFILTSLASIKIQLTEANLHDLIQFTFSFSTFFTNLMINFFNHISTNSLLVDEYKLLNQINFKFLLIDLENEFLEYKIIESFITVDILKSFSKIKLLILEKSNSIVDYYDNSTITSLDYLNRIFKKYKLSLEENNDLISVIEFELESLLPKFLKFLNENELEVIFNNLMDLVDSKSSHLRYAAKFVLKQFLSNKLVKFNSNK